MRIIYFIKFLVIDVLWVGLKFYLDIPVYIWREFNKKYPPNN